MVKLKNIFLGALFLPGILQAAEVQECTVKHPLVTVSAKQPTFSVRLASNPTTGYRWFLKESPKEIIAQSAGFIAPDHHKRVGAGGEEVWRFKAMPTPVPRQWSVRLVYARSFEAGEAEGVVCQVSVLP